MHDVIEKVHAIDALDQSPFLNFLQSSTIVLSPGFTGDGHDGVPSTRCCHDVDRPGESRHGHHAIAAGAISSECLLCTDAHAGTRRSARASNARSSEDSKARDSKPGTRYASVRTCTEKGGDIRYWPRSGAATRARIRGQGAFLTTAPRLQYQLPSVALGLS